MVVRALTSSRTGSLVLFERDPDTSVGKDQSVASSGWRSSSRWRRIRDVISLRRGLAKSFSVRTFVISVLFGSVSVSERKVWVFPLGNCVARSFCCPEGCLSLERRSMNSTAQSLNID